MEVRRCSIIEFRNKFSTKDKCLKYLSDNKWKNGYKCFKCGLSKEKKGSNEFDKRCSSCGYNESPTLKTLFHSIKLALLKAFEIIYRISVNKKWYKFNFNIKRI